MDETANQPAAVNATAAAAGIAPDTNGRSEAIKALKALNSGKAEEPATEASGETPAAEAEPKAEEPEATEVKVSPEAELKARLRAKAAAAEAKEREMEARFSARERELSERASQMEERDQRFATSLESLRRMALDDPSKFLEQTGVDLNSLVKAKIQEGKPEAVAERALRELMEFRKRLEEERAAEKRAAAEAQQNASRQAQEQEFLSLATPESTPVLARLAKKNPSLAIQNAYLISGIMQRESGGKLPDLSDLAKRVDAELRAVLEDDAPTAAAEVAAKTVNKLTANKSAAPAATKEISEMSEAERRKEAMRVVREFRKASQSR